MTARRGGRLRAPEWQTAAGLWRIVEEPDSSTLTHACARERRRRCGGVRYPSYFASVFTFSFQVFDPLSPSRNGSAVATSFGEKKMS